MESWPLSLGGGHGQRRPPGNLQWAGENKRIVASFCCPFFCPFLCSSSVFLFCVPSCLVPVLFLSSVQVVLSCFFWHYTMSSSITCSLPWILSSSITYVSDQYLNFGYLILSYHPRHQPRNWRALLRIHTTASPHTVAYQYELQPSLYPCLKDKMPPDRGRASRACESCRKQKTRCYESGMPGRPCFRCERLRQRCSFVQTPPQPALGSAGGVNSDNTDVR